MQEKIVWEVKHKEASRLFSKTTPFHCRYLSRADPVTEGISFLIGVIDAKAPRHQWMDQLDRKPRCSSGGHKAHLHCFVRLMCLPFAVYSFGVPVSFGKEDVCMLRWCSRLGVRTAFSGICLASSFFRFGGESTLPPQAANANR